MTDAAAATLRLGNLANSLKSVTDGPTEINEALAPARHGVLTAFRKAEVFLREARTLVDSGALTGAVATDAKAAVACAVVMQQKLAECYLVLMGLSGSVSAAAVGQVHPFLTAAARDGAAAQVLATWEADWLREAAVNALAGSPEKKAV